MMCVSCVRHASYRTAVSQHLNFYHDVRPLGNSYIQYTPVRSIAPLCAALGAMMTWQHSFA